MYLASSNAAAIVAAARNLELRPGESLMILLGEDDRPDIAAMLAGLDAAAISCFGGFFTGVIDGETCSTRGALLLPMPLLAPPILVQGLERTPITLPALADLPSLADATVMVWVDGLTANIASFLDVLFDFFGDSPHYLGGGAGSLSLRQEPCVFTNAGLFQDAAVVALVALRSSLGVRHGWQSLMGPIVATRTHKNVVSELNWRNAFAVYKEVVEADAGITLTTANFFDVAKGYPFGIYREGSEFIVRDPIAVNDSGELICVGEVAEQTVLEILKGESQSLIAAAGQAAMDSCGAPDVQACFSLVVDCISRALFLEDAFSAELVQVAKIISAQGGNDRPQGVLSLGEISSYGEGLLEFFNKTIVVGVLYA